MSKTILQEVLFKNTTAKDLYDLYMNSKKHALATGAPAKLSSKVGGKYSVHSGYIHGQNLQLVKNKLIVQSWRAEGWNKADVDSTFILNFEIKEGDVLLHMVHANIPDKEVMGITKGWHDHYWEPWKKYLAGTPIKKSPEM